jgi:4-amino-4-deoxy-L-arabinose transferase-like glycosyltransferase
MIDRFHHRCWDYLLLIAISAIMFFLNLGGASLWDLDEGRNAECAYEMMEAGNWIIPTFNSQLRVDKPALLYWLQIFSYLGFGVNEFAARLPSAVAALVTVLLTYELARSMFGRVTGLLAGVIVPTTPMMCLAARFANPDSLLNFATVLTLAGFWFGLSRRRWWWFALLGVAPGLAVLAKGPIGLILPATVLFLFLLWERKWSIIWDRRWFLTLWTFALTALPWYLWVGIETKGEFLYGFLGKHNIERATTAMENHHGFPGYYLAALLAGAAPWSIFLITACWFGFWSAIRSPSNLAKGLWSRAAEIGSVALDPIPSILADMPAAYRLLSCWVLAYVLFFSAAATKLPNYVLPALVPCAILIARFLQRWRTESIRLPGWLVQGSVASLALIGFLFGLGLIFAIRIDDLPALKDNSLAGLDYWALLGFLPIAAAAGCWWFARRHQYTPFITAVASCAFLLLAPIAAFGTAFLNGCKAPRLLVEHTHTLRLDEDIRVGCWQSEHLPSLNFYLKRNVEHLQDKNGLANLLNSRLPVYVFVPLQDWRPVEHVLGLSTRIIGRQYDIYRGAEIVVVTNR